MTLAERLTAAADLLDRQAANATAGPWRSGDGAVWSEADVEDGVVLTDSGRALPEDARYIATMDPEKGKFLVEWLREEAAEARNYKGANPEHLFRHALGFARLLLADAS